MRRRQNFETLMKKNNNSDRNYVIMSMQITINLIEGLGKDIYNLKPSHYIRGLLR